MSQISASVSSVGMGMSVGSTATISSGGVTGTPGIAATGRGVGLPSGPDGGSGAGASTMNISSTTETLSFSQSSSLVGSTLTPSDRMAALVLALMAAVLGLDDKNKDDRKLLAGLVGLLALSGGQSSGGRFQSLEFSQSSQVTQMTTAMTANAVQASSYDQSGAAVTQSFSSSGSTLNVVA